MSLEPSENIFQNQAISLHWVASLNYILSILIWSVVSVVHYVHSSPFLYESAQSGLHSLHWTPLLYESGPRMDYTRSIMFFFFSHFFKIQKYIAKNNIFSFAKFMEILRSFTDETHRNILEMKNIYFLTIVLTILNIFI